MKSIFRINTIILLCFVLLGNCSKKQETRYFRFTRFAMDTAVEYTIAAENREMASMAMQKAHTEIERIASLLWEEDKQSCIYKFNRTNDTLSILVEAAECLKRALDYCRDSHGYFDITIKPVLDLYPFEKTDSIPPSPEKINSKLPLVNFREISLIQSGKGDYILKKENSPEMQIAVGGFAKGYAVDRAVKVLISSGIKAGIVNAGGDLFCWGKKDTSEWRIGVQHPRNSSAIIRTLRISGKAVATSGDYERYFEYKGKRYHHLLNPFDGRPARGVYSATVIADSTEKADAYATALFIMGAKKGIKWLEGIPAVEGMIIDSSLHIYHTKGFKKYLTD